MKALKVIGFFTGSAVAVCLSYLVYPKAYERAWMDLVAFIMNETTRQWAAFALVLVALVMVVFAVRTIRLPAQPKPYRSPNVD